MRIEPEILVLDNGDLVGPQGLLCQQHAVTLQSGGCRLAICVQHTMAVAVATNTAFNLVHLVAEVVGQCVGADTA